MKHLLIIIAILVVFQTANPVLAQQSTINNADLELFINQFMAETFETQPIPGAVVSVVLDNEIIFLQGYGYANAIDEIRANPSTSLFRIASITKTFTATAIMQLVEQGLIDLNTDVNTYLSENTRFPNQFDKPITVAHLLTHTAGIDETNINNYPMEQTPSITEFLQDKQPLRLYPPGEVMSYSNYGYAMLGQIVENVSGLSFAKYIDKNILIPLQMEQSYVEHSLPETAWPNRARGHVKLDNGWHTVPMLSFPERPAGSMSSTAEDMAHYMIAHLNHGQFKGNRILETETSELMQMQQFAAGADADGWTYGFTEDTVHGIPTVGHSGDTEAFTSLMLLIPQSNFGIFVSFNGYIDLFGAGDPRDLLKNQLVKQFFIEEEEATLSPPVIDADISQYVGTYMLTRFIHEGNQRPLNPTVLDMQLTLTANDDKTLTLHYPANVFPPSDWQLIDENLFANVNDSAERMVFQPQNETTPALILTTFLIPMMFERIAWYEMKSVQYNLFIFVFAMIICYPLGLGIIYLVQKMRKQLPKPSTTRSVALWLGLLATLLMVIILGIWGYTAATFGATMDGSIQIPGYLTVLSGILFLLAIAMLVYTVILWLGSIDSILIRILYNLLTVSTWVCLWLLVYWRVVMI